VREVESHWILPSAVAFLDELEAAILEGIVCVDVDVTMPSGLNDALTSRLANNHWRVELVLPPAGAQPTATIAEAFGTAATLESLLSDTLTHHLGIVDLSNAEHVDTESWDLFAERFAEKRQQRHGGLAILVVGLGNYTGAIGTVRHLAWSQRLRRLDVTIWSDLHAPLDQPEPLASLATALGVELCGWRLDLAAAISRASRSDLLDPLGWLNRRDEQALAGKFLFSGRPMHCPLQLLTMNDLEELRRRIWRAQLVSIFPWIEELRQKLVTRYRTRLRVDDHLQALGVRAVDEIELGSIAWQLERSRALPRDEAEVVRGLAVIRNALAHRIPCPTLELDRALTATCLW
jgi:hypothetical protein